MPPLCLIIKNTANDFTIQTLDSLLSSFLFVFVFRVRTEIAKQLAQNQSGLLPGADPFQIPPK